jgi:hypothetical protein
VAWRSSFSNRLNQLVGGQDPSPEERNVGINNPLRNPDWGHFSVATARLFFPNPLDPGWNPGTVYESFAWPDFPTLALLPVDPIERMLNPNRQAWLASGYNGFETSWTAAIVPVRKALDLRDHYAAEDLQERDGRTPVQLRVGGGGIEYADTSTSLLFRMLRNSFPSENARGKYATPEQREAVWEGWRDIDWGDPDIEEVIYH